MTPPPAPAQYARQLSSRLPGHPHVTVTPRDDWGRRCPAYAVHTFEVAVYYTAMGTDLVTLADALERFPGVYRTVVSHHGLMPDDWPIRYRDTRLWRPQVRGLVNPNLTLPSTLETQSWSPGMGSTENGR